RRRRERKNPRSATVRLEASDFARGQQIRLAGSAGGNTRQAESAFRSANLRSAGIGAGEKERSCQKMSACARPPFIAAMILFFAVDAPAQTNNSNAVPFLGDIPQFHLTTNKLSDAEIQGQQLAKELC